VHPSLALLFLVTGCQLVFPLHRETEGSPSDAGTTALPIAFLSRDAWTPAGGRDKADAFCSDQANDPEARSSIHGRRFLALLATTGEAAGKRFKDLPGWSLLDGTEWIASGSALWGGVPLEPLDVDQTGHHVDAPYALYVWTGSVDPHTAASGRPEWTCNDWSLTSQFANIGLATSKEAYFNHSGSYSCNDPARLYCLEAGN
jgi:hypothetical protein